MEHFLDFYVKNLHMLISTVFSARSKSHNSSAFEVIFKKSIVILKHSLNEKHLNYLLMGYLKYGIFLHLSIYAFCCHWIKGSGI